MSDTKKKKVNKRIAVSIVKVLAFVLALIFALTALSYTFFAKEKTGQFSDTKYFYSTVYTNEKENTIQIGLFGNSDLYSAFCPAGMFCMYGYTGTVVAAPRQSASESYYLLNDFLKKQSPDVIVFECDMLYSDYPDDFENGVAKYKSGLPTIRFFNDKTIEEFTEEELSIFKFHDRWKQLILSSPANTDTYMHGYFFSKRVFKNAHRSPYIDENDKVEPLESDVVRYVTLAKELCDEYGIDFALMSVPSANTWSYARHNAVQQLSDELGIKFLDMSIEPEGFDIDYSVDFRDEGNHVNYYGAKKTTAYAGNWFSENYDLTCHRYDEEYSYWLDDLEKMYEEKGVAKGRQFKTLV